MRAVVSSIAFSLTVLTILAIKIVTKNVYTINKLQIFSFLNNILSFFADK